MIGQCASGNVANAHSSHAVKQLKQLHSDVLYRAELGGEQALWLYILFEHQSTPEPRMAWRLLRYMTRIWDQEAGEGPLWPIVPLVLTTLVVNLRHLLMGAALYSWFARLSPLKAYGSMFFLGDENWALMMAEHQRGLRDAALLVGSGLALYVAWLGATAAG